MKKAAFAWPLALSLGGLAAVAACTSDDAAGPTTRADGGGSDAPASSDAPADSIQIDPPTDAGTDADAAPDSSQPTIGPGPYTLLYAGTEVGIDQRPIPAGKATFDGAKLIAYEASADERPTLGTNTVADVTGTSLFAIGRWAGGTTGGKFYLAGDAGLIDFPANGGFHYAIGIGADPIPSSGTTAYSTLAKTTATVSDGSAAPGTITGMLTANLTGATTKVGFSVVLDIPGVSTYTIASVGGVADPSMAGTGTAVAAKGEFFDNTATVTAIGGCGGCTGTAYGIVLGPTGENIALVVRLYGYAGGPSKSVSGAIVFKK